MNRNIRYIFAALAFCALTMSANAQQDDSILSDTYITKQEFVEAEVLNVRPIARTITVRGENRGESRQFTIPEGTRITIQGREARLRDIQRGDRVMLAFRPQQEQVVITRMRVPETDQPVEQRRAAPTVVQTTPTVLPKTASTWPEVFAIGLVLLLGAGVLRVMRNRV